MNINRWENPPRAHASKPLGLLTLFTPLKMGFPQIINRTFPVVQFRPVGNRGANRSVAQAKRLWPMTSGRELPRDGSLIKGILMRTL